MYLGRLGEAEEELLKAIDFKQKKHNIQNENIAWAYRAQLFLLMARKGATNINLRSEFENLQFAIEFAQRALELVKQRHKQIGRPNVVDYTRAYWLLGASCQENSNLNKADENLSKAIDICRKINIVYFEADILLDLARLRYVQEKFKEAKSLADEALLITERCGYVLQGADVNLFLAQYALEQEKDKTKAKAYAEEALKLATCDGPPYYYKVAYEEAEAMLKRLNEEGLP